MAAVGRFKAKQPLDKWSNREKLALSCSVLRSGDQNWVSVSRQIKPFAETDHPVEWFSQRNCALQYTDLLDTVETPKRKRGEKEASSSTESPQLIIARKLTLERVEELRELIQSQQDEYYKMRDEVDKIRAGHLDDQLEEMWTEIQEKVKPKEEEQQQGAQQQQQLEDKSIKLERGDGDNTPSLPATPVPQPSATPIKEVKIKIEAEDTSVDTQISVTEDDIPQESEDMVPQEVVEEEVVESVLHIPVSREGTPASTGSDSTVPIQEPVEEEKETNIEIKQEIVSIKQEPTDEVVEVETVIEDHEVTIEPQQEEVVIEEPAEVPVEVPVSVKKEVEVKQEVEEEEEEEVPKEPVSTPTIPSHVSEHPEKVELDEGQPLSPASSVASHDTDVTQHSSGGRRGRSKSRGSRRGRRSQSARKETQEGRDAKAASEIESSDDDEKESTASTKRSLSSPVGSLQGDIDLADKEHKNWKKSIMLVWRAASNHKYACVFSHPVTEEIAPGYHDIVYRPMDLQTIKKNIEMGLIHTTPEFQRDIMLMFTNAIMYNNCDHNVYHMAQEMYDDVMQHIEQYINTQVIMHSENTPTAKILRQSRRTETGLSGSDIDKEEDFRKRRTSTEINTPGDGGKAKKRKA